MEDMARALLTKAQSDGKRAMVLVSANSLCLVTSDPKGRQIEMEKYFPNAPEFDRRAVGSEWFLNFRGGKLTFQLFDERGRDLLTSEPIMGEMGIENFMSNGRANRDADGED